MEFDITQLLSGLDFDPRLVAALVAIVSLLKRFIGNIVNRSAEFIAFATAQILAFGHWVSDMFPMMSEVGLTFLSGVAIWITGKAGYKGFKKFIEKDGYSDNIKLEDDDEEVVITKRKKKAANDTVKSKKE